MGLKVLNKNLNFKYLWLGLIVIKKESFVDGKKIISSWLPETVPSLPCSFSRWSIGRFFEARYLYVSSKRFYRIGTVFPGFGAGTSPIPDARTGLRPA
jgi:hypothetical protein